MEPANFTDAPLRLGDRSPLSLHVRFDYDAHRNLAFVNFEGLTLDDREQVDELAAFLRNQLQQLGHRVNLIVNYDNFELGRAAAGRFFELVHEHERRFFLSSTRYSTDAFLRRKLGRAFAEAKLSQPIYSKHEEASDAVGLRARPRHVTGVTPGR